MMESICRLFITFWRMTFAFAFAFAFAFKGSEGRLSNACYINIFDVNVSIYIDRRRYMGYRLERQAWLS